jgi:CheY-like chemotaxis protein
METQNFDTDKKILYVDDDEMALDTLFQLLKKHFRIDIAQTPKEALSLVKKKNYDAILMDIGLGFDINGIELARMIRDYKDYKNKPIIAVTSYASKRDERFFLSHGLDYYIAKPFFKNKLISLLEKVLAKNFEGQGATV